MKNKKEFENADEIVKYLRQAAVEITEFLVRMEEGKVDKDAVLQGLSQGLNKVFYKGAKHAIDTHADAIAFYAQHKLAR